MESIGVKELKDNPGLLSSVLEHDKYLLLTKRGKPFGIAANFESAIIDLGFQKWIALKAFEEGDLSLSQLSNTLKLSKTKTIELLGSFNIPLADYPLAEDLETIEGLIQK